MLERSSGKALTEHELQQRAIRLVNDHKHVFVLCSSTDIDRLATFHKAAKENDGSLLCDTYQKEILGIFTETAGSYTDLYRFDKAYYFNTQHEKQLELIKKGRCCILIRPSMPFEKICKMISVFGSDKVFLIYSMWSGYIAEGKPYSKESYRELIKMFPEWEALHTRGHTDISVFLSA